MLLHQVVMLETVVFISGDRTGVQYPITSGNGNKYDRSADNNKRCNNQITLLVMESTFATVMTFIGI